MDTVKIQAKAGSRLTDVQADNYHKRMLSLMGELHTNLLTAEDIVRDAVNEESVYHDFFEWDDSAAAVEHRKTQARYMMRSIVRVKVEVTPDLIDGQVSDETPIKVWHHVVEDGKQGYGHADRVFANPVTRDQILLRALGELKGWSARHKAYQEFQPIREEIAVFTAKLEQDEAAG